MIVKNTLESFIAKRAHVLMEQIEAGDFLHLETEVDAHSAKNEINNAADSAFSFNIDANESQPDDAKDDMTAMECIGKDIIPSADAKYQSIEMNEIHLNLHSLQDLLILVLNISRFFMFE